MLMFEELLLMRFAAQAAKAQTSSIDWLLVSLIASIISVIVSTISFIINIRASRRHTDESEARSQEPLEKQ